MAAITVPAPVHTAPAGTAGTGLFATSAIPGASEILSASPLIAVPDDAQLSFTCSHCMTWKPTSPTNTYYSSTTPLLNCAGCGTVKYCNQTCQREDWKHVHKKECKIFTKLRPRVLPASVRAVVRLLLLQPSLPAEDWKAVLGLQTHANEFRAGNKWSEICLMAQGAREYSGTLLPIPLVLRLYCTLLVNTITLTTPTLDPIGLIFHPLAALANHSCTPTASVVFSGRTLHLRTLTPLAANAEITIPYIDTSFPARTRQDELSTRWFFSCTCALCALAPAARTDLYTCTTCHTPSVLDKKPYTCTACHLAQPTPLPLSCPSLSALHKSGQFQLTRQPLPALHLTTLQACLEEKNFIQALNHQLLICTRINPVLYPQPHHPIRVCAGFVLMALLVEVSRDPGELAGVGVDWGKAVWAALREVEEGVQGSHGASSPFAEVVRIKREEVVEELGKAGAEWVKGGKVEGLKEELEKVERVVEGLLAELKA